MATNGISIASSGAASAKGNGVKKLWEHPDPQSTSMWKVMQGVNKKYGLELKNYDDLYSWSIENIANFWGEVWDVTGVKASQPYEKVDAANCFHHAYVQPPR